MKRQKFRPAVFMVTYNLENNQPKFLIQKRKLHWKGFEFPKGGIDPFEFKRSAVKREISEEVGLPIIKIKNHKVKGKYLYKKILKDRPNTVGQTYSLYSVEVKNGKVSLDKKEHYSSEWLTYAKAIKKLTWQNQKDCLKVVYDWIKINNSK